MADLEGRCFTKRNGKLVPADFAAEEMLATITEGREVVVTVRRPRSPKNHRHFFAIIHRAHEHLPEEYRMMDQNTLLDAIKLAVGHVRRIRRLDGTVIELPESIDFGSCDETQFQRFKARALYVLGQVIGCDPAELERTDDTRSRAA